MIDDLSFVIGYGALSKGEMVIREDSGTKKFFGIAGQGDRFQEDLGYTVNQPLECSPDDIKIYSYMLTVYANDEDFVQGPERLGFTVQPERRNELNF